METKLTDEQITKLHEPLPTWAVKPHSTKRGMSAIHPMAIVDRLNEVFDIGGWQYNLEYISCDKEHQETKNGGRTVYMSAVKGIFRAQDNNIWIEQFGGSTNDDKGDSLKGGATDALTKIASYLGIGASIYKGQGNVAPDGSQDSTEGYDDDMDERFNSAMSDDRV